MVIQLGVVLFDHPIKPLLQSLLIYINIKIMIIRLPLSAFIYLFATIIDVAVAVSSSSSSSSSLSSAVGSSTTIRLIPPSKILALHLAAEPDPPSQQQEQQQQQQYPFLTLRGGSLHNKDDDDDDGNSSNNNDNNVESSELLCDLPDKVSEDAIHLLVQQVLKDPNINIRMLPDNIERKLYETTVRLTLNAIYKIFQDLDGKPVLGHYQLQLQQYPQSVGKTKAFQEAASSISSSSNHVNYKLLEQVADRLLQNPIINQPLIPDVLERQIYINSLKVAFRVLDILQSSLRIRICGHWLGISLSGDDGETDDNYDYAVTRAANILATNDERRFRKISKGGGN